MIKYLPKRLGDAPGPWKTSRDAVPEGWTQVTVYDESNGERIATVFRADAVNLIAKAPLLLEALDLLQRFMDRMQRKADTCKNNQWRGSDQRDYEACKALLEKLNATD